MADDGWETVGNIGDQKSPDDAWQHVGNVNDHWETVGNIADKTPFQQQAASRLAALKAQPNEEPSIAREFAAALPGTLKKIGGDVYQNLDQPLAAVRGVLPDQVDTGMAGELGYSAAKTILPEQGARALVGGVEQTPGIVKGMVTPENVAWAGASAIPGAQPLVAGHFARLGAEEALGAVPQYQAATTDPERAAAVARGLGGAAMVVAPVAHTAFDALRGAEEAPTMPQEAPTAETPARGIPPVERRVAPQWNELGEDIRYQNDRRAPGNFVQARPPAEPELKIEPVQFEKGVHPDDVQTIRAAEATGRLTAEDLRAARGESPAVTEAGGVPRGEAPAEVGRAGPAPVGEVREPGLPVEPASEEALPAVDNAARAGEATVPAEGERAANITEANAGGREQNTGPVRAGAEAQGTVTPDHVKLRATLPGDVRVGRLHDDILDRVDQLGTLAEIRTTLERVSQARNEAEHRAAAKEPGALQEFRDLRALSTLLAMKQDTLSSFGRVGAKYTYERVRDKLRAINIDEERYNAGERPAPVESVPTRRERIEARQAQGDRAATIREGRLGAPAGGEEAAALSRQIAELNAPKPRLDKKTGEPLTAFGYQLDQQGRPIRQTLPPFKSLGAAAGGVGRGGRRGISGSSVGAAAANGMDNPTIRGMVNHLAEQMRRESNDLGTRIGNAVGGRGLRFAEQASPEAAKKFAASGSSEAAARSMVGDLVSKARELKIEPETALKTLIAGQLEGQKYGRYPRLLKEVREAGPDDIHELFRDELKPVFQGLLRDTGKYASKAAQAERMSPDELYAYVEHTLQRAADQVKIDPAASEVRATPAYQEWLKHYDENFGKRLQKAHEEAGGTTLKDLGPDNTYFPLTSENTRPLMSRLTPWKTRPARSAFRTGLGESYSTDLEGLVQTTRQILRQDNVHAALQNLIDKGAIKEYRGKAPPEIGMLNGREVKMIREPLGDGRTLSIPEDLYKEVKPIIDGHRESISFLKKVFNVQTEVQIGGLTDAAAHLSNVGAATIYNSPEIAMALVKRAATDERVIPTFQKWREALSTDPRAPENRAIFNDLVENGLIGNRYGRLSYTKAGAESTGGKTLLSEMKRNPLTALHAAGPLISGPKGLDIRARIAFGKALEVLAPEATWAQKVQWFKDLGTYNAALQDSLTRGAKDIGVAPFVVAGRTFNNLGRRLFLNPLKSVPGTTGGMKVATSALHAATSGYAVIGYWWLAHMALTGKTPTEAKANLFEIEPTDEMKRSALGQMMKLNEKGAKLTANFPYSLPARGARALGLQALWKDTLGSGAKYKPKAGQVISDMAREALNTAMHPVEGPPVKNIAHAFGIDPYIGSGPPWKGSPWQIPSSIPEGTPPGKNLTEQMKSVLLGANPMLEKMTGGHQSPEGYFADTLLPRLIKHPFKPKKYQGAR